MSPKPTRLAAIEALPTEMQDHALVDWPTVALMLGMKDVDYAREIVTAADVPLVHVSDRRRLPTWRTLRQFIETRQRANAPP
jgi:hypothetical protein